MWDTMHVYVCVCVQFIQSKLSQCVKNYREGIVMSCAKSFLLPFLVFVTLHDRTSSMT